ncbi:hypothetical protein ACFLUY_01165 [Chloroflexota bacterium]
MSDENLRLVYQSQIEKTKGHHNSIFNAFSLSIAGLLVLLAGIVNVGFMLFCNKWIIGFTVSIIGLVVLVFIIQQRREIEKARIIMRPIERKLRLYDEGAYIPETRILPRQFEGKFPILTKGDWLLVIPIVLLVIAIAILLVSLPNTLPT